MQEENIRTDEEKINVKEMGKEIGKLGEKIKEKIKDPIFWIDNITIITLIGVVIYFGIKGHYLDVRIVEVCNGMPTGGITP